MFADLDPEEVHQIMDGCFRLMMTEIHGREGTINQFRGDALWPSLVRHWLMKTMPNAPVMPPMQSRESSHRTAKN